MTFYSKLWFWLLIIALILLIIGAILFEWYNSTSSSTEWWIWGVLILGVLVFLGAFVLYLLEARKQVKCCDPYAYPCNPEPRCAPAEPRCPPAEPRCPPPEPRCPPPEQRCPPPEQRCPPPEPRCPPPEPRCSPAESGMSVRRKAIVVHSPSDSEYESEYEIRRISSAKVNILSPPVVRTS